jgi:hypothetical protein
MRRASTVTATLVALVMTAGLALTSPDVAAATPASSGPTASSTGPCGTMPLSSAHYTHVIWVWMENHSYSTIIGSKNAPYINSLAAQCGLATKYHNITHPSLPNYVGATAGLTLTQLKPFKSDCNPSAACSTSAPSIFGQGETWKSYEESMPANCFGTNSGEYAVRHNPPPYFTTLSGCSSSDVPYTQLSSDLTSGTLPQFSFVTPNLIDDMHDGTVADGNAWLSNNLPSIFNSSEYQSGTTVVLITWDEGEGGLATNCADNSFDVGCHVATIVVSPSTVPGTKSATLFNHYSLLRTTEDLLGLPELGLASKNASMAKAFNL